jgi:biotin-dependent carboxylase-like uncharacterized protein
MIEVLSPGPRAIIEDLGRHGLASFGVGRSGAADLGSHRLANRLVGNSADAATIEITLGGLDVVLRAAATVALTGAPCPLSGRPGLSFGTPLSLPAGSRLTLGTPATGLRSYLAIRGGFDVAGVLGSRSTDTLSGLGPAPLAVGDLLTVGGLIAGDPAEADAAQWRRSDAALRVVPGPRAEWFESGAWSLLTSTAWRVGATSDRIGLRLSGAGLQRVRAGELASEPTLPGAIQVPPDGDPIVLGPDAPVTGGYPVIGVVAAGGLDHLAQLRPGDEVRFARA